MAPLLPGDRQGQPRPGGAGAGGLPHSGGRGGQPLLPADGGRCRNYK